MYISRYEHENKVLAKHLTFFGLIKLFIKFIILDRAKRTMENDMILLDLISL